MKQQDSGDLRPCKVYRVGDPFEEVFSGKNDGDGVASRALRLVTFNVMMDSWKGEPYMTGAGYHAERYAHIVTELRRLDADVVLLNEVTPGFLRCARGLTAYLASGSPDHERGGPNAASGMGNLLLVHRRLALRRMFSAPLPRSDRPAVGADLEPCDGRHFAVVSAHLSALTGNVERRAAQLAALAAATRHFELVAIAGDLNWHVREEEQHAPPGFRVAGYAEITFDGRANAMHQHLWPLGFEARQMALDRVLVRSEGDAVKARDVQVIFNKPLYEDKAEAPQQLGLWDKMLQLPRRTLEQTGLLGAGDKEQYLFPSDHFGLICTIELQCNVYKTRKHFLNVSGASGAVGAEAGRAATRAGCRVARAGPGCGPGRRPREPLSRQPRRRALFLLQRRHGESRRGVDVFARSSFQLRPPPHSCTASRSLPLRSPGWCARCRRCARAPTRWWCCRSCRLRACCAMPFCARIPLPRAALAG